MRVLRKPCKAYSELMEFPLHPVSQLVSESICRIPSSIRVVNDVKDCTLGVESCDLAN